MTSFRITRMVSQQVHRQQQQQQRRRSVSYFVDRTIATGALQTTTTTIPFSSQRCLSSYSSLSSSSSDPRQRPPKITIKPWNDTKLPLESRVRALVGDSHPLHPADLYQSQGKSRDKRRNVSSMEQLLQELCASPPLLENLELAQQVLDRWLMEKRLREFDYDDWMDAQQRQQHRPTHQEEQQLDDPHHDDAHQDDTDATTRDNEPNMSDNMSVNNSDRMHNTRNKCPVSRIVLPAILWETVLHGWVELASSKSFHLDPPMVHQRMQRILYQSLELARADDAHEWHAPFQQSSTSSRPTTHLFNLYLRGLARLAPRLPETLKDLSMDPVMQARQLVKQMHVWHNPSRSSSSSWTRVKPDAESYRYVMQIIAARSTVQNQKQVSDAGEHSWQVLQDWHKHQQHQQHRTGKRDGQRQVYASALFAMANSPNSVSLDQVWHVLLRALSHPVHVYDGDDCGDGALVRAALRVVGAKLDGIPQVHRRVALVHRAQHIWQHDLLDRWEQRARERGTNMSTRDLREAYNGLLELWAHHSKCPEAAWRCQELLNEMTIPRDGIPLANDNSFHLVQQAWGQHRSREDPNLVPQKALEILMQQVDMGLAKEAQSYTMAIQAQTGNGDLGAAQQLLETWLATRPQDQVASSKQSSKKQSNLDLLSPFTAVLKVVSKLAPASTNNNEYQEEVSDPFEVALQIWSLWQDPDNELVVAQANARNQGMSTLDHHFFAAFLMSIRQHVHPSSVELMPLTEQVWQQACDSGQVSSAVWSHICTIDQMTQGKLLATVGQDERNMCNPKDSQVTHLPRYWWRNVPFRWQR